MPEPYFDPSRVILREVSKETAKNMIIKYHYSHKWTLCRISYGIYYKLDKDCDFFKEKEEKLIGVVVYGQPVGRSAAQSISDIVKISEVFELTRLFIHDQYGRNIESYCVAQSLKMVKRDFPQLKVVISYADNEAGHRGGIYQATNFLYQGNSTLALLPNHSISLVGPPYKWMHSRTVSSIYGSHNVEHLKKKINHTFYRKRESSKHRYIYFLCNKTEKKRILKNLKHPILPYPKEDVHQDEIEEIKVESVTENLFFG